MRGLRTVVTAAALAALTASAQAQGMGAGMTTAGHTEVDRREGGAPAPKERESKPANEKDYKSSLNRLPNQKYDPWAKAR